MNLRNPNPATRLDETIDGQIVTLNLGPTHPATHGVFQNILKMDGERILSAQPTIGYIHRAFEKIAEHRPYNQKKRAKKRKAKKK